MVDSYFIVAPNVSGGSCVWSLFCYVEPRPFLFLQSP